MKMSRLGKWIVGLVVALGFTGVALASTTDVEASTLYRAYNPNTGEHLYTQNGNEIPFVVRAGWRNEGTAWEAPSQGARVYRMFNPNNGGDHHYTLNMNEVNMLKGKGWRYEGESWKSGGSTPVYRLYNPNAKSGTHHFTILASEKNNLVRAGWRYEGVAFYSGKDTPNTGGNNGGNGGGSQQLTWTVWYNVPADEDQSYALKPGQKKFATEGEAKAFIDKYARETPTGSTGFGYRQI
ncbi:MULTISPECIES: hypothetical protein [Enterococcus]|jgi:hypothetical protein|uniref:DUF5648 domain-containing protein n=1 Tax=Enterococcus malodoratus ATCC 43197 TaxID=1158601 RepID=R2QYA2_9ENTE|nr:MULTISPECIES: hypothetical protein [Enterococcus]EOH73401.1 hypothetical protein UAI_03670 [Enterococcus malodoratus ATCC 43197]EOT67333.1 hypothetical protein I585_02854 [Enterococcus malodoratus ATCC 43197]MDU5511914.1 hypothetical protein [Enterococcus gilvus]OJG57329.1 hypothetical protein RV07_GL003398 [Enterococcus malodoratus]SET88614.1 hypothetical protein SAMN04487821_12728 [Enterococcus malodoratus]